MKLMEEEATEATEAVSRTTPSAGGEPAPEPVLAPAAPPPERHFTRFGAVERVLHLFLMTSFLGLAATGLPLLFSDERWASALARAFGGFHIAGLLHRFSAAILIVVFVVHVARVLHRLLVEHELGVLWGPESMVPQPRDFRELAAHFRWFIGRGPRPAFDHFTYWEKFDYWAVFWGMVIIGGSGLLLWFPQFFSRFLPGWVFNVALLVHGEEALLAVGFIFTIHFFNGHLRPEKFPMDTVIFSGRISETELGEERPGEYERLAREGRLDQAVTIHEPGALLAVGRVVGAFALVAGFTLVLLIVYAGLL